MTTQVLCQDYNDLLKTILRTAGKDEMRVTEQHIVLLARVPIHMSLLTRPR